MSHLFDDVITLQDPLRRPIAARFAAIAGVDLSLTNTGVAVYHHVGFGAPGLTVLDRVRTEPTQSGTDPKGKKISTWTDRQERLVHIVTQVADRIPKGSLVFLEAPSYGSVGSGTFDRSGLWWMVYDVLVTVRECRVIPVAPSQRMLYATGKGGGKDAGKDAVIAAVVRAYPDLDVTDNNVADAVILLMMGRRAAGIPAEASIPAANLKAMIKLESI